MSHTFDSINGIEVFDRPGSKKGRLTISKLDRAEDALVRLLQTPEMKNNQFLEDAIDAIQRKRKEWQQWF